MESRRMIHGEGSGSGRVTSTHQIAPTDMVVAVMGLTGAGKSTFIRLATGSSDGIGHGLESFTNKVDVLCCPHPNGGGRNVVFVDTPGFDDTIITDIDVLESIANWLKETYQMKIKLSGLLYCHRISDNRMAGAPMKNLKMFRALCGADALRNVILVTTMWDELDLADGAMREEELKTEYWASMFDLGVRTARFDESYESAWDIIKLLDSSTPRATLIQKEMVDKNLSLDKTTAGRSLLGLIQELIRRLQAALQRLSRRKRFKTLDDDKVLKEQLATLRNQSARFSASPLSKSSFRPGRSNRNRNPSSEQPSRPPTPPVVSRVPNAHSSKGQPSLASNELAQDTNSANFRQVNEPRLQEISGLLSEISERAQRMRFAEEEGVATLLNGANTFLGTVAADALPLNINDEMYKGIEEVCESSGEVYKMLQAIEARQELQDASYYDFEADERGTITACNEALQRVSTLFDQNKDNIESLSRAEEFAQRREGVVDKSRPSTPPPIVDTQRSRASSFRSSPIGRLFQRSNKEGKDLQRRSSTSQIPRGELRPASGSAKSPLASGPSRQYHSEEIRPVSARKAGLRTPFSENLSKETLVDKAGLDRTMVLEWGKQTPELPRLYLDFGTPELDPTMRAPRASELRGGFEVTPTTPEFAMDARETSRAGLNGERDLSDRGTDGVDKLEISAVDPEPCLPEARDLTNEVERIGNYCYASGGFGDIWKGTWKKPGQSEENIVAIKVLRVSEQNASVRLKAEKRLRRELSVWQRLDHPNLLPFCGVVYGYGAYPSFVCPWMGGGCLTNFLGSEATLPTTDRLRILCDIANGLEHLHQIDIIHGDLTSPNVLIHSDGRALLSDFGLSNLALDVKSATFITSTFSGNARWTAPELLIVPLEDELPLTPIEKKHHGATLQSDIYSFGSVTLETLSGKVPYHSLHDTQVLVFVGQGLKPRRPACEHVSDELWNFIQDCWAPAGSRPSSSDCRDRLRKISCTTC